MAWYVYVFWFFAVVTFLSAVGFAHKSKWGCVTASLLGCVFWSFLIWYNGGF